MRKTFVCSMCVLLLILGSWMIASTSYGNSDAYLKSWEYRRTVWRNRGYYHFKAWWKMRENHQAHSEFVHHPVSIHANAMFSRFLKKQIIMQGAVNISLSRREELKEYADKYKPSVQFKNGEPYFPCDFYFDHDTNVGNNKDNYPKDLNEKIDKPRYFVHIQENEWDRSISAQAIAIEYWYYYVADTTEGHHRGHEHDWEVFIIFLKQTDPSKVLLLKAWQHGRLVKNNWENVEKENITQPRLYADYKHAMWYHASWNGPKVPYNKLENKPIFVWDQDAVQGRDGDYDYIPNWEGSHEYGDWAPKSQILVGIELFLEQALVTNIRCLA